MDVYAERFQHADAGALSPEEKQHRAVFLTGAALTTALVKLGWRVRVEPGERIVVEREGVELLPFDAIPAMASGSMGAEDWLALCNRAHILEVNLNTHVPMAPACTAELTVTSSTEPDRMPAGVKAGVPLRSATGL